MPQIPQKPQNVGGATAEDPVAKKDSDIMAKVKGTFLERDREQEQDTGAQGTVPVSYGVSSGVWIQFWGLGSVLRFGVSSGVWIQFWGLDSVLGFGVSSGIWIQFWGLGSVL